MNAPIPTPRASGPTDSDSAFRVSLLHGPLRSTDRDIPLVQLLGAIRQYHRLQNLSHQERAGTHDLQSRRVLKELADLETLLQTADHDNSDLEVSATLHIELIPRPR